MTSTMSVTTVRAEKKAADIVAPFHVRLGVGAVAGMTGTSLIYPIDRLKTALMTSSSGGVVSTFRSLLVEGGVKRLYRGLGTNLLGVGPEKALKLGVNDYLRDVFKLKNGGAGLLMWQQITAAAIAGTVQTIATNPYELLKIRLQMDHTTSAREWVRRLGVTGLYRGLSTTIMRDVPYSVIFFPLYATLRESMQRQMGMRRAGSPKDGLTTISAGIIAGGIASAAVTPFDVVKTRFQAPGGSKRYGSVINCFRTVARDEGQATLWKGAGARAVVVGTLYGVSMLFFELLKTSMVKKQAASH